MTFTNLIRDIDLCPKPNACEDGIIVAKFPSGRFAILSQDRFFGGATVYTKVFSSGGDELYPAIPICYQPVGGTLSNPMVIIVNGNYVYSWHERDEMSGQSRIVSVTVPDTAEGFHDNSIVYRPTTSFHTLFANHLDSHYVIAPSADIKTFVIASSDPASGRVSLKKFDSSSISPLLSTLLDTPYQNNQHQIATTVDNNGFVLFSNIPKVGIKATKLDSDFVVLTEDIVVDIDYESSIENFAVTKSGDSIFLTYNSNGIIKVVAYNSNGNYAGEFVFNDYNFPDRYSLVSCCPVNQGAWRSNLLTIVENIQDGLRYVFLVDAVARQYGDKASIDNNIEHITPIGDNKYLVSAIDLQTGADSTAGQIVSINFPLLSFSATNSPSTTDSPSATSEPATNSNSQTISYSQVPSTSTRLPLASPSATALPPEQISSSPTRSSAIDAGGNNGGAGFNTPLILGFSLIAIALLIVAYWYKMYKCKTIADKDRPEEEEMEILLVGDQLKKFLEDKEELILSNAPNLNKKQQYYLLEKISEFTFDNGYHPDIEYCIGNDSNKKIVAIKGVSNANHLQLLYLFNDRSERLDISIALAAGYVSVQYPKSQEAIWKKYFQDHFKDKKLLNDLTNLMLRFAIQAIDSSDDESPIINNANRFLEILRENNLTNPRPHPGIVTKIKSFLPATFSKRQSYTELP